MWSVCFEELGNEWTGDIPVDGQVSVDGQCLPWPVLTSMLKLLVQLADISYPSLQMWTHNHLNNNNSIKKY